MLFMRPSSVPWRWQLRHCTAMPEHGYSSYLILSPPSHCDCCDIVSVIFPDSGHSDTTFIQLYNTTILYNTTMLQNTLNRYLMLMLVSERF